MPDCPLTRVCSWTVKTQEVHHDWWTTSAATWLLAFALVILLIGWAIFQRAHSYRHQVSSEEYTAISLGRDPLSEISPPSPPRSDDTQDWEKGLGQP